MKKIALTVALYATIMAQAMSYASPPSRAFNYTAGSTISSTQVNTNEIAIYTYLQNGVDNLAVNTVSDSNVIAGAGIQYSKLNLAGGVKNADIAAGAGIVYSKLTLTNSVVDGDIVSITSPNKVSTASIYGTIALANLPSIDAVLPSQAGNSGKFLTTNAVNASWGAVTTPGLVLVSTTTITAAANSADIAITQGKNYLVVWKAFNPNAADLLIRIGFNGALNTGITSRDSEQLLTTYTANTWAHTSVGVLIDSARYAEGTIKLISRTQTADSMAFFGEAMGTLGAGTFQVGKVEGIFVGTATSFRFNYYDGATNVGSGTIWLYEVTQ